MSRCIHVYPFVARNHGGAPFSGVCPFFFIQDNKEHSDFSLNINHLRSDFFLRVPYTQYGFYLYLHVPEGVPVRKKNEILD